MASEKIIILSWLSLCLPTNTATGAVFIDLQKAFDTVEHKVLLSKLPLEGIAHDELN